MPEFFDEAAFANGGIFGGASGAAGSLFDQIEIVGVGQSLGKY